MPAAFQPAAVAAEVQSNMAGYPRQERVQVFFRAVRRDGIPRFRISVVFTFLRGLVVPYDSERQRTQTLSVFFSGVPYGRFVPVEKQADNL